MDMLTSVVNSVSKTTRLVWVGFAVLASVLYDVFFWNQEKGIGFLLFVVFYLLGTTLVALISRRRLNYVALALAVPIIILSVDVVLYTNDLVVHLVPWVVFVLCAIFTLLITLTNPQKHPFSFRAIPLAKSIDLPFSKWGHIIRDVFVWHTDSKYSDVYKKIALSFLIAAPLLLVFGFLFSQADAIFADRIARIFSINFNVDPSLAWRVFRTIAFALYLASFLYVVFGDNHQLAEHTHKVRKFDFTVAGIVLGLVNALFLTFVFIQIKYLFGTAQFVVDNQLTFAEYARSGFFELVWVMVIATSLIALYYRSFANHGHAKVVTALQFLLIVQIGVIAASALKRMNIYQHEYGFTTLRLYVEWFIYFVLLGLAGLAASIVAKLSYRKFFYAVLVYGVLAFTLIVSINVNRIIAERNISRYVIEGKVLDLWYLESLGADVSPYLVPFYSITALSDRLKGQADLRGRLEWRKKDLHERYNSWREYNVSAAAALEALEKVKTTY